MENAFDFVKLHAGWDECILIFGEQLPKGEELNISLSLLKKPSIGGTEVGILYPPNDSGDIRVKIVDATSNSYIRMCGGLTQSLGKAIVETNIGEKLGITIPDGTQEVLLETDAGLIPIEIEVQNHITRKVVTKMDSYLTDCYERGVELEKLDGMSVVDVGINEEEKEFLVIDIEELSRRFSKVNFFKREEAALNILEEVYRKFLSSREMSLKYLYGALYQLKESGAEKRIQTVFRFFPWDYSPGDNLEFACGTGTIAIGIAMYERGQIDFSDGTENLFLTVGGKHLPSGTRAKTHLQLEGTKQGITSARFSHDRIEIVASGKIYITA